MLFHGTVLWHQGKCPSYQPLIFQDELVLLFNGDLYMEEIKCSDTEYLFDLIKKSQTEEEFLDIFKRVVGPYSFICYFKNNLYVGRDSLGRNSLIIGKHKNSIFFTSVTHYNHEVEAIELPSLGIYKINSNDDGIDLFPFQELSHNYSFVQLNNLRKIVNVNLKEKTLYPDWLKLKTGPTFNYSFDEIADCASEDLFDELLGNSEIVAACDKFIELLSKSVKERVERTQNRCKKCILDTEHSCSHAHISILFSGGVDCTILASLADKFIDREKPIDLLNVAFEKVANKSDKIDFNVPDRVTGLSTFDELKSLSPERKWNFVEINVKRIELQSYKKKLTSLIYPLDNVLDESLGTALYFASRGKGKMNDTDEDYESPCRVILMGSGADELFGGYTRHRNAFKRTTPENDFLQHELDYDWIRLPSRNLARDDRVIGDNGVTVRAPFIEENFVNFARSLKSMQRCFPKLEEGVGDKLLLRLVAYRLGLHNCSHFRKRAIQFGSRIADKRQCANDKSQLLQYD